MYFVSFRIFLVIKACFVARRIILFGDMYNPGKNQWDRLKGSSKIGEDQRALISASAKFLAPMARFYLYPSFRFSNIS